MEKSLQISQKILIRLVLWYRLFLSPYVGRNCRFEPTCSLYTIEAIENFGCFKGCWLGLLRILRCHPFCKGGHDPIPSNKSTKITRD